MEEGSPGDILTVLTLTRETRGALDQSEASYGPGWPIAWRRRHNIYPRVPSSHWHRSRGYVSSMSEWQPRYLSRGMKTCDIILRPPPILRAGDWVMPWSAHSALSGCQVPSQHLMGSSSEKYASSTKRRPQVMISPAHHRSVWPRRHQLRTFSLFSDFRDWTAGGNDGVSF